MLTDHAMKLTWANTEKGGEVKEFESLHELKMAVVALEACIKKVFRWNNSFTTVAIFLHTIEFGETDLAAYSDRLTVLADFIDEILKFNAQAWDEERFFLSAQEVTAKWSALLVRKNVAHTAKPGSTNSRKKADNSSGPSRSKDKPKYPSVFLGLPSEENCKTSVKNCQGGGFYCVEDFAAVNRNQKCQIRFPAWAFVDRHHRPLG